MLSLSDARVHEATLPNALRVVVAPQTTLHRVTVALFVGVGSRYETPETNGVSHFLEHMLYRGTARHPSAHLQNLAFERIGGNLYAATHADHTYISVSVPPASLGDVLELLAELVRAPRLGEIDVERRIVREEILENLDEDGRDIDVDNVARGATFGDHPLGYTITGPLAAIDRFDEGVLRAHLDRYYVGANAVLAVAGACDPGEVMDLASRHFAPLAAGARTQPLPFEPTQRAARRRHVPSPGSQSDLRVSFLTPGEHSAIAPAIELLMRILDDGMSTRLYHRLCDAGGLVYECHGAWEPFAECGVVDLGAEVQHARLAEVVEACFSLTRELASEGGTPGEITKARDRHRWGLESALDDPDDLASIAGGAVFFGRPRRLDAQAARFDEIGPSELAAAAREIFRPDRLQIVTVGSLTGEVRERFRASVRGYGAPA